MSRNKSGVSSFWQICIAALAILLTACSGGEQYDSRSAAQAAAARQDGEARTGTVIASTTTVNAWGTYLSPFAANSLWNSRPINPLFGTFVIPTSSYYPAVAEGTWSTGAFESLPTDSPMTVRGYPGTKGLWHPDSETYRDVTIPRWPANVAPAAGSDGHADIVDPATGMIHAFFKLKFQDGQWYASQYSWTRMDGRGWGDPSHFYQGARATGVPTVAGLIRKHEINDGEPMYRHALAMSLTHNGLSPKPAYSFPATSADFDAATTNTGQIPEGSLVMLPSTYNTAAITNPDLRKVAETLKVYGAYVVDRNNGTPFLIYVENGSGFSLHKNGWNSTVGNDLQKIRAALRQVVSVDGWMDGDGLQYTPNRNLNMLSMRGSWQRASGGTVLGAYDTWAQALVFPATTTKTVMVNYSSRALSAVTWALPAGGMPYQLTAKTTGGATLRLQIYDKALNTLLVDSGELQNGQVATFTWPTQTVYTKVTAGSGVGQGSSVQGELINITM